jgi:hypothetical protein
VNRNGIYWANKTTIGDDDWARYRKGQFDWALVRVDTGLEFAKRLVLDGVEVVVQAVDCFNQNPFTDPAAYAFYLMQTLYPFMEVSQIAVLDNEPNLSGERGSSWWAEHFTRWFRTVMAAFRYYDAACHWQLCFPGICHPWTPNGRYWLEVGRENVDESEIAGIHTYWWGMEGFYVSHGQREIEVYLELFPDKRLLVLEYGDSHPSTTPEDKAIQDVIFTQACPEQVAGAFKFLLTGTEEWGRYFLTNEEAEALGQTWKGG